MSADKIKKLMYDAIDKYGIGSKEALKYSQMLDKHIVAQMKKH